MRKEKISADRSSESATEVKKTKRSGFFAFLVCILLAMVIWAYSEADVVHVDNHPTTNEVENVTDAL